MKKKDQIKIKIEDLEFPSKGIGFYEGKKIFVKNTIPGQVVRIMIQKVKKDYAEGKLVEVLEKAPIEIESFCEHFGECGGCAHQTIPYEEQLNIKANLVKKLLEQAEIKNYEFLEIERSPEEFSYRNKMEYSFGDEKKGGEMTLGMHRKGRFHDVVTVDRCRLVDQDFNHILNTILKYFKERDVPIYNARTHQGYLRHLIIRKSKKRGEMILILVTSTQFQYDMDELVEILKNISLEGKLVGFLHTFNDSLSDAVVNEKTEILWGQDYLMEEILGLEFKISAYSFFQTNPLGAEKLYRIVLDFIEDAKNKVVFDLYCGTGTIGQIIAKKAKKVIGIEIIAEAVKAANENAKVNHLNNCTFIAGDVLKKIDELKEKPDLIILDPPRVGVHPKALQKILRYGAPEIIYISCNPRSLAENLIDVQKSGYKIEKVKCMDMFPHTPHVECIALIQKEII